MAELQFIQMSGAPGAGKSTIARALAPQVDAVIIDHDVTKSALLTADLTNSQAGRASYYVLYALAEHLLAQEQSVIFDSPCWYDELLERGQALAHKAGAVYRYIECRMDDLADYDCRLRGRPRRPSQVGGIGDPSAGDAIRSPELFANWIAHMKRPKSDYLVLDTKRPLADCVADALVYLTNDKSGE